MQNFQQRTIDAPAAEVGALMDRLGSPQDLIWPTPPGPRCTSTQAWPSARAAGTAGSATRSSLTNRAEGSGSPSLPGSA